MSVNTISCLLGEFCSPDGVLSHGRFRTYSLKN